MLRRVATHPRAVSVRALASRQRLHTAPVCRALDEHDIISVRRPRRAAASPSSELDRSPSPHSEKMI